MTDFRIRPPPAGEDDIIDIDGDICPVCEFDCTCGPASSAAPKSVPVSATVSGGNAHTPLASGQPASAQNINAQGGHFGVFALNTGPTAGVFPAPAPPAPTASAKKQQKAYSKKAAAQAASHQAAHPPQPHGDVKKDEQKSLKIKVRPMPLPATTAVAAETPARAAAASLGPRKRGRPSKKDIAARQAEEARAAAAAQAAAAAFHPQPEPAEASSSSLTDLDLSDAGTARSKQRRGSGEFPTFVSAFTSSNASDSEGEGSDDSLDLGDDTELEAEEERAILREEEFGSASASGEEGSASGEGEREGREGGGEGREGRRRRWAWQKGMRRERERRVEQGEEAGERPLAGADDDDDDDDDDEEEEEAEDDDADRQHTASPPLAPAAAPPAAQEDSQWTESSDDEEDRFFAHLSDFSDFSSDFYSGRRASAAAAAAARGGEETESDSTGDDEGMDGVEGSDGSLSSVSRAEAARAGLLDYAAGAGPWRRSRRSKGKGKVPAKPHAPSPATSAKLGKRKRPYTTSDDEKRRKPSKRREKRPKMVLVEDGEGRLVFGGEWERESLSWASEEEEMMELFPSEDELPRARPADAGGEEEGEGEATEPEPERLAFVPLSQPDELLLPLPSLPLLPVLSSELDSEGDGPSEASSEWTGEGETTDEEDVPGLRKEEAEAMLELGLVRSRSAEREREREREMQGVDPMLLSPPALGLQMELAPPAPTLASVIASAAAAAAAPPAPPVLATPTKTPRAVRPLPRPIPQSSSKVVRPHPLPALSTWTTPLKSMIFVVDGTDRAGVSPFARLRWTGAGQKRRRESSSRSEASWYYEGSKRARTAYDEEHGEDLGLEHDPDQENELDPSASSQGELALVRSPESPDALDLDDLLDTSYFLYDESIPSSEAEGEDNEDEGDTAIMRHLTRLDSVPLGQWFRRARAQGAEAGMEMSLSVAAFAMDHEGDDTLLAPDLVGRSMVVVSPIIFPARDAYIPERSPSPVMLDGEAAGPLSSISLRAALSPKKRADKAVKSHKERRRDKKRVLGQKGGGIDVTPKVRNRTHGRPF